MLARIDQQGSSIGSVDFQRYWNRRPDMTFFRKLLKNKKGATAIEYGLIAALIAVAAITAMGSLGNQLNTTFTGVKNEMARGNAEFVTK
jgi:pilus assembly protein Flp/PilA